MRHAGLFITLLVVGGCGTTPSLTPTLSPADFNGSWTLSWRAAGLDCILIQGEYVVYRAADCDEKNRDAIIGATKLTVNGESVRFSFESSLRDTIGTIQIDLTNLYDFDGRWDGTALRGAISWTSTDNLTGKQYPYVGGFTMTRR